jgi:uncharacterized protein (TIGR04255 family)
MVLKVAQAVPSGWQRQLRDSTTRRLRADVAPFRLGWLGLDRALTSASGRAKLAHNLLTAARCDHDGVPMPLTLPEPSTTQLAHAPLELVVCQVRHDRNLAVADATRALAVREALGDAYPHMEEQAQQQLSFLAGPTGLAPLPGGTEQRGWRFRSADGAWTVALLPDFYALECTGYTSWTEFRTRLVDLTHAVSQHLQPALELRLGLRYIDRITRPVVSTPTAWTGLIQDNLLGPVLHPDFCNALSGVQGVLQMVAENGEVLLRHGTQPDDSGNWPYLLDTDCYRSSSRRFAPDTLLADAEYLHKLALQVFQASITPRLFEVLVGHEEQT